jgi:hypothetical protein
MEDAASLAIFLSSHRMEHFSVEARLSQWNEFRRKRACTVQSLSINGPQPKTPALIQQIRVDIGYEGPLPEDISLHEADVQRWLFQYDVRKEANEFIDGQSGMRDSNKYVPA